MSLGEALHVTKKARASVCPNSGFLAQLESYACQLQLPRVAYSFPTVSSSHLLEYNSEREELHETAQCTLAQQAIA